MLIFLNFRWTLGLSLERHLIELPFDSSKFLNLLIISVKVTFLTENGKATSEGICFFISSILGWFSNFFIALKPGHGEG